MLDSTDAALDIRDLRVRRGKQEVLHGVNVRVPRGSLVGLLGPSGCGKSTLMRSIVGVQRSVTGTVTLCGSSRRATPYRGQHPDKPGFDTPAARTTQPTESTQGPRARVRYGFAAGAVALGSITLRRRTP